MAIEEIAKSEWQRYLEDLTKTISGRQTSVEVASAEIGDQPLAERVAFLGLSYDARRDEIEVALENIAHRVVKPRSIFIDREPGGLIGIEIIGADDARTIIRLSAPLMLPGAA
jgi:hypothetical protein